MIAKTTNLNLFYGKKQALFDINMQIEQNKITTLIGASGCGKSTFLRCFNRMNDKIAKIDGLVEIEGKDVKNQDVVALRKNVGMVFQQPNVFVKSIYENISYAPKLHGMIKNKDEEEALVVDCLQKVGLFEEVKEHQRLLIASLRKAFDTDHDDKAAFEATRELMFVNKLITQIQH